MFNSYQQKGSSSTQYNHFGTEKIENEETDANVPEKMVQEISQKISSIMLPLYDSYKFQTENGKIMGFYPVLKFPSFQELRNPTKQMSPSAEEAENFLSKGINYRQIANRIQQKERQQNQSINQNKMHELLDPSESRPMFDQNIYTPDRAYSSNQNAEMKKLEKARRHYEKLSRQLKSNKKLKRRFKDKSRPKKAKSAYNLFVQEVVPQIKAENPSFSAPDLVRVAAKMYNQLTEEEKIPYQRRYMVDKERFERERQAYFRQHPQMDYRLDAKQKASFMTGKYMQI